MRRTRPHHKTQRIIVSIRTGQRDRLRHILRSRHQLIDRNRRPIHSRDHDRHRRSIRISRPIIGRERKTVTTHIPNIRCVGQRRAGIAAYPGILWDCPAQRDADITAIANAGATWTAFDADWKSLQEYDPATTGTDTYGWTNGGDCHNGGFDAAVLSAKDNHNHNQLQVLGILTYSPPWARDTNQPGCGDADGHCFPDANHVDDFARFAGAAAARYGPNSPISGLKNSITSWQIWNEPNHQQYANPWPDPVRYADMVKQASAAIKQANPAASVITGGTAPTGTKVVNGHQTEYTPLDWLKQLYANNAGPSFDAVGHHPYNFPCSPLIDDPTNAFQQVGQLHAEMVNHNDGAKLIWGTEMGAPTGTAPQDPGNQCFPRGMTDAEQALQLYLYYQGWNSKPFSAFPDYRTITGPMIWKSLRDNPDGPEQWWDNQGLFYNDRSLAPKPAFTMFQQVTSNGYP